MPGDDLNDLAVFLAVVDTGSFTRAAAQLGTSQSAESLRVQRLETGLGVRLLQRTTRKVAPTDAGERLAGHLRPSFEGINQSLADLRGQAGRVGGTLRLTSSAHAARTILWPAISALVTDHPDLSVEVAVDSRFIDIVAEKFDAGVRLGDSLDADMIALRIGPDLRMAVFAAPSYLARKAAPQHPRDLTQHNCINLRLPSLGNLYAWEFSRDGQAMNIRVNGRLTFNTPDLCLQAALDGHGIGIATDDAVQAELTNGRLVRLLANWCPPFPGYHLYYPSRRQIPAGLALLIEELRRRRPGPNRVLHGTSPSRA